MLIDVKLYFFVFAKLYVNDAMITFLKLLYNLWHSINYALPRKLNLLAKGQMIF